MPCRTRKTGDASPALVTRCGRFGGTANVWPAVSRTFSFGVLQKDADRSGHHIESIVDVVVIVPRHLLRGTDLQLRDTKTRAHGVIGAALDLVASTRIRYPLHVE